MELSVKIDATEVRKMVADLMGPDTVLLSAEAVRKLASDAGFDDAADLVQMMRDAGAVFAERGEVHADDIGVDRFAAAMKAKLRTKREDGFSGWNEPDLCDVPSLARMLVDCVGKGDPVDIGNFAMMLHQRECMAVQHHPCYTGLATNEISKAAQRHLAEVQS